MKTLTITEAKKNLGKWLNAASNGEEVGIINGATIVALQPVEVRAVPRIEIRALDFEYAHKEYGVTRQEYARFIKRIEAEGREAGSAGTPLTVENPTLEKLEKALNAHAPAAKAARRSARPRPSRRA